jgi:catechol 2,3-dioxygenase-like lactoylglutathione lyase family enzyme
MFTYVCLGTNDLQRATSFYDAVLGALGLRRCITNDPEWDRNWAGWGAGAAEVALWLCKPFDNRAASAGNGTMVALSAKSWKEVQDFHAAGILHGGVSEGAPGLRPQYNPDFYAAYLRDPDGNKLSTVCRGFTSPQE